MSYPPQTNERIGSNNVLCLYDDLPTPLCRSNAKTGEILMKALLKTLVLLFVSATAFADMGGHSGGGDINPAELVTEESIKASEQDIKRLLPIFFYHHEIVSLDEIVGNNFSQTWISFSDPTTDHAKQAIAKSSQKQMQSFLNLFETNKVLFNKNHPADVDAAYKGSIYDNIEKFGGFFFPDNGKCMDDRGNERDAYFTAPNPNQVCLSIPRLRKKNITNGLILSHVLPLTAHELIHKKGLSTSSDAVASIMHKQIEETFRPKDYYSSIVFNLVQYISARQLTLSQAIEMIDSNQPKAKYCNSIILDLINNSGLAWSSYLDPAYVNGFSFLKPKDDRDFKDLNHKIAVNVFRVCSAEDFNDEVYRKTNKEEVEKYFKQVDSLSAGFTSSFALGSHFGYYVDNEHYFLSESRPIHRIMDFPIIETNNTHALKKLLKQLIEDLNKYKFEAMSRIGEKVTWTKSGSIEEIFKDLNGEVPEKFEGTDVSVVCSIDFQGIRFEEKFTSNLLSGVSTSSDKKQCNNIVRNYLEDLKDNVKMYANGMPQK